MEAEDVPLQALLPWREALPGATGVFDFVGEVIGFPPVPLSHQRGFAQHCPNLLRVGINHNAQIVRHGPESTAVWVPTTGLELPAAED